MANASESSFRVVRAESTAQFDVARALFREYAATLETGICLVGFERELTVLPEMYGAPDGTLLLAVSKADGSAFGCAGVRRTGENSAELKRVYVQAPFRNMGAGRALTLAAIEAAKSLGYACVVLDTLNTMTAAQAMYRKLGFEERSQYQTGNAADATTPELRYFSRAP